MTTSGLVAGWEGVAYYNSATYGTPTWVECTSIKDCGLPLEKSEEACPTRGTGGWNATAGVLKDAPIEFQFQYKKSSGALPADVQAFLDAWLNGDLIDCEFLDGPNDVTGVQGLRAWFEVIKFKRNEPVSGLMTVDVSVKPGLGPNNPDWITVS